MSTPDKAAQCAQEIQREFHIRNLAVNQPPLSPQPARNYDHYPEMPGERLAALIRSYFPAPPRDVIQEAVEGLKEGISSAQSCSDYEFRPSALKKMRAALTRLRALLDNNQPT